MKIEIKNEKPWPAFLMKMGLIATLITLFFYYVASNYRIGIDTQMVRCFPDHKYFFVELVDSAKITPERDSVIAYSAKGLKPFFKDGTLMAKIISGVPGDHLKINSDGIFINNKLVTKGFAQIERLGVSESSLYKDEIIPDNHFFLTAPAAESYDSRYWGYITQDQIVGTAHPLF